MLQTWISPPTLSFNKKLPNYPANEALFDSTDTSEEPPSEDKLRYTWVLWEQSRNAEPATEPGTTNYGDLTREVASISTVQEFWSVFNSIPQPSELLATPDPTSTPQATCSIGAFMLFKQGVRPEWEDPTNKTGGHLQFTLQAGDKYRCIFKENSSAREHDVLAIIDEYWNNLVLSLIGNTIPHIDDITGIRLVDKVRPGRSKPTGHVRIEIWFARSSKIDSIREGIELIVKTRPNGTTTSDGIPGFRLDTRFHDEQSMINDAAQIALAIQKKVQRQADSSENKPEVTVEA
jgi:hypothetical protein